MADNQSLLQGAVAMSTIAVALLIALFVALMNPGFLDGVRNRVAGAAGQAESSPTGKIIVGALGAFAPDMAILSGFVSDIVNVQFRHSVLSFSAILAVVLNRFIFGKGAVEAALAAVAPVAQVATGTAPAPAGPPAPTALGMVNAPTAAQQVVEAVTGRPLLGHTGRVQQPTGNLGEVSTLQSGLGGGPAIPVGGSKKSQKGGALPDFFQRYYNPCAIRGLAFMDTEKSPMGMVALMTIFSAVFWDMWINNKRTTPEILGNGAFGLLVLLMNFGAYAIFNCYGNNTQERLLNTFKAFVWGAIVGSVAFLIFQYAPNGSQYLPIDPSPASLSQPSSGQTPVGPGGQQACPPGQTSVNGQCTPLPTGGAKCNAPNDGDQFVCDAYKNGKLISTTFSS